MTWFIESPWPVVVVGLAVEIFLAVLLVRDRRGNIVGGMIAVATFTVGLVVIEHLVVTNSEEIEELLDTLTRLAVAKDDEGLRAKFTGDSPKVNDVVADLSDVTIRRPRIKNLEIRVDTSDVPSTAAATFTLSVEVRHGGAEGRFEQLTRQLKVTLHKESGHWLVYNFTAMDPEASQAASAAAP